MTEDDKKREKKKMNRRDVLLVILRYQGQNLRSGPLNLLSYQGKRNDDGPAFAPFVPLACRFASRPLPSRCHANSASCSWWTSIASGENAANHGFACPFIRDFLSPPINCTYRQMYLNISNVASRYRDVWIEYIAYVCHCEKDIPRREGVDDRFRASLFAFVPTTTPSTTRWQLGSRIRKIIRFENISETGDKMSPRDKLGTVDLLFQTIAMATWFLLL